MIPNSNDLFIKNRYLLIHLIAEGQLTKVWIGLDTDTNELFAIKVISRKQQTDHQDFIKAFKTEAKVLQTFKNPHIVRIVEFIEEENRLAIVMEYVPGKTVAELIKAQFPKGMAQVDALKIIRQVADALHQVHGRGILHGDIKPTNIKLTPQSIAKLLDFGMALDVSKITSSQFHGTPAYMSPEQVDPATFGTPRVPSDVYSLGATLYEMLVGHPPFSGTNVLQLAKDILYASPRPLSTYRDDILSEVEQLVLRCLEKDPARRFQTAQELVEAIDRLSLDGDIGCMRIKQARHHFDAHEWHKVIDQCRRVPSSSACYVEAQDLIGKAEQRLKEEKLKEFEGSLEIAAQSGDWDRVNDLCREILTLDPSHARAKDLLSGKRDPQPCLFSVLSGRQYALRPYATRIGRASRNSAPDIDLGNEQGGNTVSRDHAQIIRERDGTYYLEVRTSREDSSWLNGVGIVPGERKQINEGDQLRFGDVELIFRIESA